jgi:hypothetical protein
MEPSVIAYELELTSRIRRYLDGELSFNELAYWVENHELSWAEFEFGSLALKLSGLVMMTLWENQDGVHTEDTMRDTIGTEFAEIVGSPTSR